MKKTVKYLVLLSIGFSLFGCKAGKGTGPNGLYTDNDTERDKAIADAASSIVGSIFNPGPKEPSGDDSKKGKHVPLPQSRYGDRDEDYSPLPQSRYGDRDEDYSPLPQSRYGDEDY